jgi:hypothetical protein
MTILALNKSEWRAYFDRMAKGLRGKRAEIEVESIELRDQIEVEWVPLLGVTYDPKSDILEIALDGLERLVPKPQQIFVDVRGADLNSFEVIDPVGTRHIVRLRAPLTLPAPPKAGG